MLLLVGDGIEILQVPREPGVGAVPLYPQGIEDSTVGYRLENCGLEFFFILRAAFGDGLLHMIGGQTLEGGLQQDDIGKIVVSIAFIEQA